MKLRTQTREQVELFIKREKKALKEKGYSVRKTTCSLGTFIRVDEIATKSTVVGDSSVFSRNFLDKHKIAFDFYNRLEEYQKELVQKL